MTPFRKWLIGCAAVVLVASCTSTDDDGGVFGEASNSTSSTLSGTTSTEGFAGEVERQIVEVLSDGNGISPAAAVAVPLQMYYLERYFAGAPDPTETDLAIRAILDDSPGAAAVFESALATYRAISLDNKYRLFDPEMVDLTAPGVTMLDLDRIGIRLGTIVTPAELGSVDPPEAPSDLTATNTSVHGDPDGRIPPIPRVSLSWADNSGDEDGFRIYRWLFLPLVNAEPGLIATVGRNTTTYDDVLLEPATDAEAALTWCYQVTSYSEAPIALAGQDPPLFESDVSAAACSGFWPPVANFDRTDTDGDGIFDINDECPGAPDLGSGFQGCPDEDGDWWPDQQDRSGTVDHCTVRTHPQGAWGDWPVPNDTSGVTPPTGCPYRFAVSWMGMEVTANSAEYLHPLFDVANPAFAGPSILYMNEVDEFPGEEPWLTFSWVNGLTASGPAATGSSEWCCGEGIDVAQGDVWEPDATVLPEAEGADLAVDTAVLDHGLVVFPTSEISRVAGMELTIALLEKDWTAFVRESQDVDVGDMIEVGLKVVDFASCVYAPTVWCLIDTVELVVDFIESIFGMADTWVEVDDPDDWMGDGVWGITRNEALHRTTSTGAYGFIVEIPTPQRTVCVPPVSPCTPDIWIPAGLIADVYLCVHREGILPQDLSAACGPLNSYERVLPWPMEAP